MECISAVRHLVRDLLGCTCPEEVFDDIDARWRGGVRTLELRVGGRLLIHVRWPTDWLAADAALSGWIGEGRVARDREGFNRFRLVLALAPEGAASAGLRRRFAELAGADERLHLHLLPGPALAALTADWRS
jgi:hypothetical protein